MKNENNKMNEPQIGMVLFSGEFLDIITGRTNKIERDVPESIKDHVEEFGIIPIYIQLRYKPGNIIFVREGFRPERKTNGDIHRYQDDKDTFVAPPSINGKWKKMRWYSPFSMREADSRLFLVIKRFRLNKAKTMVTWTVQIDMERSKPQFWPKVSDLPKKVKAVKKSVAPKKSAKKSVKK